MSILSRMTHIAFFALSSQWSRMSMMSSALLLGRRAARAFSPLSPHSHPSSRGVAMESARRPLRSRSRRRGDVIGTFDRGGGNDISDDNRRRSSSSNAMASNDRPSNGPPRDENSVDTTTTSARGREKRKQYIGLAKAVDRGQYGRVAYNPGGFDGSTFVARSGLPRRGNGDDGSLFCVLGIESSCDDTGAAVMRSDGTILGESLASQREIHEEFGGVVPGLAKTAHEENIDGVIHAALRNANMTMDDIDAIGVTVGPGLEICLRVGCNKGRELAMTYGKPFVGVHHLEAHILMARIPHGKYKGERDGGEVRSDAPCDESTTISHDDRAMDFPFLALLVSGGHCQILKCLGIGRYAILGGTLDDSLGEAFDKTARLLGLPVGGGGGPAVEALSAHGDPHSVTLPIPMQRRKDCDFSYAGLKTSVRMAAERMCVERGVDSPEDLPREDKANIAASFQHVAFRHVEVRLGRAMEKVEREDGIRTLAVVGGVAANKELRRRLNALCSDRTEPWELHVPPPRLCTDQGAMSAWAAVERLRVGSSDLAEDQEVFARYPFSVSSNDASS
jgi:N6-L-threonylcarbamoyladenine synthase